MPLPRGVLQRLGEMLMRRSESDPRLARAAAQGYDLLNPVVHGTNNTKIAESAPRAFYATTQPEHALQYTGGSRRAGIGAQNKGGVLIPAVLRGKPLDTGLSANTLMPMDDFEWLRQLGIEDPETFRRKVWEQNVARQMARPNTQTYLDRGMTFDNAFGNSMGVPDRLEYPRSLHEVLDAITEGLAEESPLLKFAHQYRGSTISPKGRVMRAKEATDGDAILVADPSLARSPWAQFADEEVGRPGLMKKRGGAVRHKESCK